MLGLDKDVGVWFSAETVTAKRTAQQTTISYTLSNTSSILCPKKTSPTFLTVT